jgi:hypothetical protein
MITTVCQCCDERFEVKLDEEVCESCDAVIEQEGSKILDRLAAEIDDKLVGDPVKRSDWRSRSTLARRMHAAHCIEEGWVTVEIMPPVEPVQTP